MNRKVETVRVAVRCRPISDREIAEGHLNICQIDMQRGEVYIANPKGERGEPPKCFTFDSAYGSEATQEQIYVDCAYQIVDSVLEGYNGTIFAYGQTGTGKTFTMSGKEEPTELRGITPRAFEQIFYGIEQYPKAQFLIRASFLEIYNEDIHDLLSKSSKNKLDIKENPEQGFYVKDLTSFVVKGIDEMKEVMAAGQKNRHVGETLMNRDSSRSHSIFMVTVERSEAGVDGAPHYRVGKLNLVDLAGSERQSKTGSTGERLKEATNINKSLLTLGNVISALVDGNSQHVPYRDSKLTKLLMDSLGGNTKTVMIANFGPVDYNYDETISTLRYANRAKSIKNKPKINEDIKDMMLREFQDEISRLKAQLALQGGALNADQLSHGGQILQAGEPIIKEVEKIIPIEDKAKIKAMEDQIEREKEEIKEWAEEERKRIEREKSLAEEEKQKIYEELQKQEQEKRKAKENQQKLIKKLKAMEDKLIQGSQMMEFAVRQEQELQRAQMEIEMRRKQERDLQSELEKREVENVEIEKRFSSLQEEIEEKDKKLKSLWKKYQEASGEIKDLEKEFNREREDLAQTISILSQQYKLKELIINSFIPQEEQDRLESLAQWSDEMDDWMLPRLDLAGNAIRSAKPNPIKKSRDGEDVENKLYDKEVQSTLVETQPNVYFVYTDDGFAREESQPKAARQKRLRSAKRPGSGRPGTASKKGKRPGSARPESAKKEAPNPELYPQARGLVSSRGNR